MIRRRDDEHACAQPCARMIASEKRTFCQVVSARRSRRRRASGTPRATARSRHDVGLDVAASARRRRRRPGCAPAPRRYGRTAALDPAALARRGVPSGSAGQPSTSAASYGGGGHGCASSARLSLGRARRARTRRARRRSRPAHSAQKRKQREPLHRAQLRDRGGRRPCAPPRRCVSCGGRRGWWETGCRRRPTAPSTPLQRPALVDDARRAAACPSDAPR